MKNTNTHERSRVVRRKKSIAGSFVAGAGALALALAVPLAAHAATVITTGDLDAIEVEATESAPNSHVWDVELLGHDHDTDEEFDPTTVIYEVTADEEGIGTISESSPLSAGFSPGSADFLADLTSPFVTFTLTSATRSGTTTGSGAVTIDDLGDIYLDFDADTYSGSDSFDLTAHSHPEWLFAGKGTYTLEFEVSAAYTSPTVVNGLPESVTVVIDVI